MIQHQTLVEIRERSFLDLLDLSLMVVRSRPRTLAVAAAGGIAPFAALNMWLLSDPDVPRMIWPLLLFFEAPWATAPLTLVLGGLMFGQGPGPGAIARRLAAFTPSLILAHVLVRGLLLSTVVFAAIVPARFWFASEVILLEQVGGFRALGRCLQLSRDRSGESLGRWVGMVIFGVIFAFCFWVGTGAGTSAVLSNEITWDRPALADFGGLRFQLGVWLAIAFFAVARFLIYIDQRIRSEGWELRLRLKAAAIELERGRP
jgi:hypothetical protein